MEAKLRSNAMVLNFYRHFNSFITEINVYLKAKLGRFFPFWYPLRILSYFQSGDFVPQEIAIFRIAKGCIGVMRGVLKDSIHQPHF